MDKLTTTIRGWRSRIGLSPRILEKLIAASTVVGAMLCVVILAPRAAEYYVAIGGSNNNPGTSSQPWRTISYAANQLTAGDTLWIDNGTYDDSLTIRQSGPASARIVVRAINDGKVTIDGQRRRKPAILAGSYITVEGIVFTRGSSHTMTVAGSHNVLRRVSAYYSKPGCNCHVIESVGHHNLFEDVVAAGSAAGRHLVMDYNSSGRKQHNVYRRVFAAGHKLPGMNTPSRSEFNIYGASNVILENCIGWGGTTGKSLSVHSRWNKPRMRAQDNKVLGSIFLRSEASGGTIGYGNYSFNTLIENTSKRCHQQTVPANGARNS